MGTGECLYEPVPYCISCDPVPGFHGTPIYYTETKEQVSRRLARWLPRT